LLKWFLGGNLVIEGEATVTEVKKVAPEPGDRVRIIFEGTVESVGGDEVEVRNLAPVGLAEVIRG
jgi:hypothetical protein